MIIFHDLNKLIFLQPWIYFRHTLHLDYQVDVIFFFSLIWILPVLQRKIPEGTDLNRVVGLCCFPWTQVEDFFYSRVQFHYSIEMLPLMNNCFSFICYIVFTIFWDVFFFWNSGQWIYKGQNLVWKSTSVLLFQPCRYHVLYFHLILSCEGCSINWFEIVVSNRWCIFEYGILKSSSEWDAYRRFLSYK